MVKQIIVNELDKSRTCCDYCGTRKEGKLIHACVSTFCEDCIKHFQKLLDSVKA